MVVLLPANAATDLVLAPIMLLGPMQLVAVDIVFPINVVMAPVLERRLVELAAAVGNAAQTHVLLVSVSKVECFVTALFAKQGMDLILLDIPTWLE